jgi:hypothetical protein
MKLRACWNYFYIEDVWDEEGYYTVCDSFPYISYKKNIFILKMCEMSKDGMQ